MQYLNSEVFSWNKSHLYLLLVLSTVLITFVTQEILITDHHYYQHYGSQLSIDRIETLIQVQSKWAWIMYVVVPVLYLLKFSLLSTWILVGIIFFGYRVSFKHIFQVVIISEFVFLLPALIRLAWFGLIHTNFTLQDLHYFTPLSLASFFDLPALDPWWVYPLQSFNIFEVVYVLVLAMGIRRVIRKDYAKSLRFTIPVYGSGLMVWIIFVTFLTLNFS